MVARGEGKLVVWPYYFDKNLSRAQGRRVPLDLAVEDPRAGTIAQAARTLGFKTELEEKARPPREWHKSKGRVVLAKASDPKEAILKQIARRL